MAKVDASGPRGLSLQELLRRLRRLSGLMQIKTWDADANAA